MSGKPNERNDKKFKKARGRPKREVSEDKDYIEGIKKDISNAYKTATSPESFNVQINRMKISKDKMDKENLSSYLKEITGFSWVSTYHEHGIRTSPKEVQFVERPKQQTVVQEESKFQGKPSRINDPSDIQAIEQRDKTQTEAYKTVNKEEQLQKEKKLTREFEEINKEIEELEQQQKKLEIKQKEDIDFYDMVERTHLEDVRFYEKEKEIFKKRDEEQYDKEMSKKLEMFKELDKQEQRKEEQIQEIMRQNEADKKIEREEYINLNNPKRGSSVALPLEEEPDNDYSTQLQQSENLYRLQDEPDIERKISNELEIKDETNFKHDNHTGGSGDVGLQNDDNYENGEDMIGEDYNIYSSYEEYNTDKDAYNQMVKESGVYRSERKYNSNIAEDEAGIHTFDNSAGDGPEDIGERDYIGEILQDNSDSLEHMRDLSMQTDDFGDFTKDTQTPQNIRNIQKERHANLRGDTRTASRLRQSNKAYRTSTGSLRKQKPEEMGKKKNERNRYDQVQLVRESNLNHLRSITELLPNV